MKKRSHKLVTGSLKEPFIIIFNKTFKIKNHSFSFSCPIYDFLDSYKRFFAKDFMKLNRERERLEKHNVFETSIEMFFRDRSPFCTTHVTIQLHKRKKLARCVCLCPFAFAYCKPRG